MFTSRIFPLLLIGCLAVRIMEMRASAQDDEATAVVRPKPASAVAAVNPEAAEVPAAPREDPQAAVSAPGTETAAGQEKIPPGDASEPGVDGQRRREAIVQNRDAASALELGWIYFERKQWISSRQWFERALEFDPKSSRAAEGLVMTAFRSGDPAEAYRLAKKHAALVPEATGIVAQATASSAEQMVEAGELEKAEAYLKGVPEAEVPVAKVKKTIAERRVETAVARQKYEEARTIAAANQLDDASVSRDESADLLQQATEARDAGNHSASLELVEKAEKVAPLQRGGRRVKAWSLYQNRRFAESSDLFEELYREGRDRDSADGLVNSLQQAGEVSKLSQLSRELGGPLASASEPVLMAIAKAEAERQRQERERHQQIAMAQERERQMHEPNFHQADKEPVPANTHVPVPEGFGGTMATKIAVASSSRFLGDPIDRSRQTIPETPRVNAGGGIRVKEGDGGLDRLRVTHLPSVETTLIFGPGDNQSLTLGVHASSLEAGDIKGGRLVGSADSTLDPGPFVTETDTLVEPTLAYRLEKGRRAFFAEIGSTPIGADISAAAIGGIGMEWHGERAAGGVQGFSESVKESLLSYTGMKDPQTGKSWGRVVKRGVRADGVVDLGNDWGGHGMFEFSELTGEGVADNTAFAAEVGLTYELDVPGFEHVAIGPTFHYEAYDKNLSQFTSGHGGYFSPEQLFQGMFGVSFLTETGGSWLAGGYVGVGAQSNDQASSPVLPNSPDGQFYDASSESSAIFTARLQTLFELNPQWRLGADAGYAKTAAYEDFAVSVYLSFLFNPEWGLDRSDFRR